MSSHSPSSPKEFVSLDTLLAQVAAFQSAPKDHAAIETLCFRPDFGQRDYRDFIDVTPQDGIIGERWAKTPWMKLPDGSGDPGIQVSILGKRVIDAVRRDPQTQPHPGDTIIADIDCSEDNLPAGQLLEVGTAVLRVSEHFNNACVKWKVRYGADALAFINRPELVKYRLRGALCSVHKPGRIHKTDTIRKI